MLGAYLQGLLAKVLGFVAVALWFLWLANGLYWPLALWAAVATFGSGYLAYLSRQTVRTRK